MVVNGCAEIPPILIEPTQDSPSSPSPSSANSTSVQSKTPGDGLRSRAMAILSPRSSNNYDRLENGMGPSRGGVKKWFGWKKFALGAVVLISLIWFFGPREPRNPLSWGTKDKEIDAVDNDKSAGPGEPTTHIPKPPPPSKPSPINHSDEATLRPTSFETDPDPSKTVFCKTSFKDGLPLVQYALMIDAGSTGSRIHVYKFNNCGASAVYEYETFKMTQPGLSSFAASPVEAAKSLDILLDEAIRVVPESLRKCTPVAVKATAGLRLLPGSQSADILAAVRQRLHEKYPFQLHDDNGQGVVIMDGKDEGVYAWITANYLLNTIRADTPKDTPTYAVLDLGGASTQIVFEPMFTKSDAGLEDGEHKYDLQFGGKTHILYQHSYLGYGLMRARRHVHRLVDFMATLKRPATGVVGNPCLARGTRRVVEIEDERTGEKRNVTMDGEEIGAFESCNRVVELVLAKDSICELKPCSFDGVYQPSLLDAFSTGRVLLLSYFYDRLQPLLPKTDPPRITVSTIASLAHDVCLGRTKWLERWGTNSEVMDELSGRPEWCLDLTFMHGLLRLGYEFGDEREVTIGKQIEGTELGWCLGATIAMVGGELKCRI